MKDNEVKTGFIYKPTQKHQWVAGSKKATVRFGAVALMPDGHGWGKYKPLEEPQSRRFETSTCTVFATLKALITLATRYGYDFPKNCSERFSAIVAKVKPPGANPFDVAESIRTTGVIHESVLPFTDEMYDITQFFHPDPMDEGLVKEANKIVKRLDLGHEYLFNGKATNKSKLLREGLSRGTVCVSVHAWKQKDGIYYKEATDKDGHWVQLIDYKEGEYWLISDQYKPYEKKVAWNTDFQTAEVYFMKPNPTGLAPVERSYFSRILARISEALTRMLIRLGIWKY